MYQKNIVLKNEKSYLTNQLKLKMNAVMKIAYRIRNWETRDISRREWMLLIIRQIFRRLPLDGFQKQLKNLSDKKLRVNKGFRQQVDDGLLVNEF